MKVVKHVIAGADDKPIALDITYDETKKQLPVIIFSHGFKGFKDWGAWHLVAEYFAEKGYCFVKFNFSHNGTSPEHPTEFTDLEAFSVNNFMKELEDLGKVIDYMLNNEQEATGNINKEKLYLIGHSRGGATTILKAAEDDRVKKIVTWAGVSELSTFWKPDFIERWKEEGIAYIYNTRTGQQMPMKYEIYENYLQHKDKLSIQAALNKLKIQYLIVQGDKDETVVVENAYKLKEWNKNCPEVYIVEYANHVFGAVHPYKEKSLPVDLKFVVEKTHKFLLNKDA